MSVNGIDLVRPKCEMVSSSGVSIFGNLGNFFVIFVSALIGRRDTFALFLKATKLRLGVTRIEMHATFLPNNF